MQFAERMDRFGEGIFSKLLEIKRQKEERGETVIDLGVGAPNIPPARHITDALCEAAADPKNYVYAISDQKELLEAAAQWLSLIHICPGTKQWNEAYAAQTVIRPEDRVDAVGASMIITFREVLSAIRRFGFQPNETAVVFGAGPVGLCFTRFLKLLGLKTVITTDILEDKVETARRMGACLLYTSSAPQ